MAHPDFGKSVNPILTRREQIMPTTSLFSPGVSELPTALERNGGSGPQLSGVLSAELWSFSFNKLKYFYCSLIIEIIIHNTVDSWTPNNP